MAGVNYSSDLLSQHGGRATTSNRGPRAVTIQLRPGVPGTVTGVAGPAPPGQLPCPGLAAVQRERLDQQNEQARNWPSLAARPSSVTSVWATPIRKPRPPEHLSPEKLAAEYARAKAATR